MYPSTENESCIKCKLFDGCRHPFMRASGSKHPKILVVGEAPGEEEDNIGKPFVGRSGQLLRDAIDSLGYSDEEVAYTNVVRCRPPNNKITKKSIGYCKQFALADIERLDPEMVFVLGNSALEGILDQTGISAWSGVVVNKERKYIPLYHPAYILRNIGMFDEWTESMITAIDSKEAKQKFVRMYPKTIRDLKEMQQFLMNVPLISFDSETHGKDPFQEDACILSVSFAGIREPYKNSYSFPLDHPESWWNEDEHAQAVEIVCNILYNHMHIVCHNAKYDQMWMNVLYDAAFYPSDDTMMISQLLNSRPGLHGLKRLAGVYVNMYDYAQDLYAYIAEHKECDPERGGSYKSVPLDMLIPYGSMDAEATILVYEKLFPKLSDKQKVLYRQLIMPVSDVLCNMQIEGVVIDKYLAQRYYALYSMRQQEIYDDISKDPLVKKMIAKRFKADKKYVFNPNSHDQLRELFYDYYDLPPTTLTDGGQPSTSGEVLKPFADKYPIVKSVRYYGLLDKMLSTYLGPALNLPGSNGWARGDGKVNSQYILGGAVTGRLASKNPNLQNIPTPEKEPGTLLETLPIKNIFTVPDKDHVIMSLDYSGMELRCFASLAKCMPMIDIHKSGKDFHTMVASMVSGKPYDKIDKATRYIYKWTNWTLLYGGDAYTLSNMYGIPIKQAERSVTEYYDQFPEVLEFKDDCEKFTVEHGYIESPFGRREYLPYIKDPSGEMRNRAIREAVNMPVQSGASDTLLIAMTMIDEQISNDLPAVLVNTVHDSVMLYVHRDVVEQVATLCVYIMENVVKYAKKHMPGIDFSWLICPLKADVDVGTHYGSLVQLEEWK